ncbi:MAG: hydrogenase expression/formation protein HypE [Elusimicrobia bacterium RIFOXYC2_FULL_34_12]|nr:MAG: hydrogenase expression/formation protein HypE [Elusimicrobia bacterium RIFOXYC2_FULL_34_12]OGS39324.1 MAG: hydrogenase expression/formation protein HypE [Elusimicrobia bacterium RIFOXYD2_FULL_34_30]HAM39572.1 hydrogenase expression/formation protein HypE [Elusimicrobiota bacterium]
MENKKITLSYGSGGKLMHQLIKNLFLKKFGNVISEKLDDSAVLPPIPNNFRIVFTTDSYVVKPIFFPGGDIGKLSICGTINDLSVMGAKPRYISVSAIIEEGLEIEKLEKIINSIAETSKRAGVQIVCGDTKVVEKGAADEIFLTTSGVGILDNKLNISGRNAKPGNIVILSGTIADHGIAILNARQELELKGKLLSDVAPLNNLVEKMLNAGKINTMRDPTRGGLATTLNEIAEQSDVGIEIIEERIPINKSTKTVCNLLGLDPIYIANEGKLLAIVEEKHAEKILSTIKKHPLGKNAEIIGKIISKPKAVFLKTRIGGTRILQMLESDQLPRIC